MYVKKLFFEVLSKAQKDSEDVSEGINFKKYFISFPAI
jgi:hypothetical protein